MGCFGRNPEEAMAKYTSNQATQDETETLDEDFFFDEDEDALMEQSQRKLIQAKRERPPRMRDY
jgi:hypothetical protein